MKSLKYPMRFLSIFALVFFSACGEDDDDNDDTPNIGPCPAGTNFCMQYGNQSISGNAELREVHEAHFQIWFAEGQGSADLELDIYSSGVGEYPVDTSGRPGTAAFEYFSDSVGTTLYGIGGTVEVTGYRTQETQASGTFEIILNDSSRVTDGHFSLRNDDEPDEDGGG